MLKTRAQAKDHVYRQVAAIRAHMQNPRSTDVTALTEMVGELEVMKETFSTEHFAFTDRLHADDDRAASLHDEADVLDAFVSDLYQAATSWISAMGELAEEEALEAEKESEAAGGQDNGEQGLESLSDAPSLSQAVLASGDTAQVKIKEQRKSVDKPPGQKIKDHRGQPDAKSTFRAVAELKDLMLRRTAEQSRIEQENLSKSYAIQQLERVREEERQGYLTHVRELERQLRLVKLPSALSAHPTRPVSGHDRSVTFEEAGPPHVFSHRPTSMAGLSGIRTASTPASSPFQRGITFDDPSMSHVLPAETASNPLLIPTCSTNVNPMFSNTPYTSSISNVQLASNNLRPRASVVSPNVMPNPSVTVSMSQGRSGREPSGFVSSSGVYHNRSGVGSNPVVQGGTDMSMLAGWMDHNNTLMQSFLDDSRAMYQTQRECTEMPKSKLQMFDGNPLNYWTFTKAFEDLVGSSSMRAAKKLNSLITHVSDDVRKLLAGCQLMTAAEGYTKACEILRERYGNPFLISQAWKSKIASYPRVSSAELLQSYAADLICCFNTLREMGHVSEFENSDCLSAIAAKLENHLRGKWRRAHQAAVKKNSSGTFKELVDLIVHASDEMNDPVYNNKRLDGLVSSFSVAPLKFPGGDSSVKEHKKSRQSVFAAEFESLILQDEASSDDEFNQQIVLMATEVSGRSCNHCGAAHFLSDCPAFLKLSPRDRLVDARKKRLCLLCLNAGHFIGSCPHKSWKCQVKGCVYRHHNLLHGSFSVASPSSKSYSISNASPDSASINLINLEEEPKTEIEKGSRDLSINVLEFDSSWDVFATQAMHHATLPIAPVIIHVGKLTLTTYALLDPGSTASICTQKVIDLLKPVLRGEADLTINTISGRSTVVGKIYNFEIRGCDSSELLPLFEVVALQSLPVSKGHITAVEDLQRFPHLSHLPIPKVALQHVDFLIGQDNAHLLKPKKTIDGANPRDPFAVVTPLGWTIYGLRKGGTAVQRKDVSINMIETEPDAPTPTLEEQVAMFWTLDKVPQFDTMSAVDRAVLQRWSDELRLVDGHIQLPIPLKKKTPDFPNNRPAVLARLRSLGRRLQKDQQLHKMYTEAMQVNFDKGYARQVFHVPAPGSGWYLTQLPVVHKRKPGIARPVWNGGFEFQGRSLNAEVHQGPDQTNRIVAVMTNFRLLPVAVMGDVKAMYNQVKVPPEQQDLMRFLYWEDGDPSKPVIDCCLSYHMFGGGWSPSVCTFALRKSIDIAKIDPNSEVARTILKAFYVDDCVKAVVDVATGIELFTQVITVLKNVSFDFTKLVSNKNELTDAFPEEKRAVDSVDLDFDGGRVHMQHSLGQRWQPGRDLFCFVACFQVDPRTRRELLSTLSTLYDPLGLCAPFLIPAKRMLQELTKRGLSWDDALPVDILRQWTKWVADAQKINQLEIPRWVGLSTLEDRVWLVHFCDASEVAYGDVCYLCKVDENDRIVQSNLLITRSRLAPMKSQSIPRLELCAAVVAAQLDESVRGYLDVTPEKSMFWSDSTLALRYINSEPSRYRTFIANRISVIQQLTKVRAWHHVPTDVNPADILSRGVSAEDLVNNDMWLVGPSFLRLDQAEWPVQPNFLIEEVPEMEMKRAREIYVTDAVADIKTEPTAIIEKLWEECSSWARLLRRVAWILRAVCRFQLAGSKEATLGTTTLHVTEIDEARRRVIKAAQDAYLTKKEVESPAFRKLFPRTRDGLLCVGGRLIRASLPTDFKQPYVLPAGNRPSSLLISHCHNQVHHAGVTRTLMEVRKVAWVLTGRKAVKAVVSRCVICKKYRAGAMSQVMADLPAYRLKERVRPFAYVGIDYMGPLQVKVGRSLVKRYVCVIVCSVTRAIHLEPATELTTSSFINAFTRFTSRRGRPIKVLSDNGTNFVGAKTELLRETAFWNSEEVTRHCADRGVEWAFNPPAASHFGGMWERQIRSIRSLMLFMSGGATLGEEAFQTLLCLIEGSLNSRPLTKMNDDPEDPSPITPSHLLQGEITDPVRGKFFSSDALRKSWKQAQVLADGFWKRWTHEYLSELQKRTKWLEGKDNLTVGSLVLVIQDNLPRQIWPLGLVVQTFAGGDGYVRAAEIRTAKGLLTRPIVKLVMLEADLVSG